MRSKILAAIVVVTTLAAGCSKSDTPDVVLPYTPSDEAISFSDLPENWTSARGEAYDTTVGNFREMELFAYYTAQTDWDSATTAAEVNKFMFSQSTTKSGNDWTYSPLKYWPNNNDDKITFFAFAPYGEVSCRNNATTGKPVFSYTMSQNASDNGDLMVAEPKFDCTKEVNGTSGVRFELDHKLTRITLKGAIDNLPTEAESNLINESNVHYIINGITFYDIDSKATLEYNNGAWKWGNTSTPIDYTAAQGMTLLPYTDPTSYLEAEAKSVMADDNTAIFMLPQDVTSGTLQVRVRKIYDILDDNGDVVDNGEIIYSTSTKVAIPTPEENNGVYNSGDWINMTFTFDAGSLSAYDTPMTVHADVYDWSDTDIDIVVHPNIYIYSGKHDIYAETDPNTNQQYGDFEICTNYDYDLCVPHYDLELDHAIKTSRGFMFCSDDFNGSSYETYDVGTVSNDPSFKMFLPTLINAKDKKEIVYVTESNTDAALAAAFGEPIVYDSKGFGYQKVSETQYKLLYYGYNLYGEKEIKPFKYIIDEDTNYHEIDVTEFADGRTIYFKIKIGKDKATGAEYTFDLSVRESTRTEEGLYVTGALDESVNPAYGVNKKGDDAVYIIRLSVDPVHLAAQPNQEFDDKICVEMISNGGGMITHLFPVVLKQPN